MDNTEKSYLEIKVTFHHILILLAGVILIGSFLFYLGYQAGKSASEKPADSALAANAKDNTEEIRVLNEKDPDKIEGVKNPSISEEIKLHRQPEKKTTPTPAKKQEIKTAKAAKKVPYFTIQVGAFNSHALAKNYSRKFSRTGYPTAISQAEVKGKTWYRVRVGDFKTRAEANRERKKLEKLENKKFTVVRAK